MRSAHAAAADAEILLRASATLLEGNGRPCVGLGRRPARLRLIASSSGSRQHSGHAGVRKRAPPHHVPLCPQTTDLGQRGTAAWRGPLSPVRHHPTPCPLPWPHLSSPSPCLRPRSSLSAQAAREPTSPSSLAGAEGAANGGGGRDRDLWFVLEIASDQELQELADILYGRSLLSPLLKSVVDGDGANEPSVGTAPPTSLLEERDSFLSRLEARFFFLAADAKGTITGQRPTYRGILQSVRERLGVDCGTYLATEDLEAEIFLHLCNNYAETEDRASTGSSASSVSGGFLRSLMDETGAAVFQTFSSSSGGRQGSARSQSSPVDAAARERRRAQEEGRVAAGMRTLRSGVRAALDMTKEELLTTVLKGSSAVTMSSIRNMVLKKLTKKLVLEKTQYQVASLLVQQGSKVAAAQVEKVTAMYAARQSVAGAAARYVGLRSAMSFLGPVLWGAFLADVVLQSVGTDYARIIRAIYTIAQIRLTRTYGWTRGPALKP